MSSPCLRVEHAEEPVHSIVCGIGQPLQLVDQLTVPAGEGSCRSGPSATVISGISAMTSQWRRMMKRSLLNHSWSSKVWHWMRLRTAGSAKRRVMEDEFSVITKPVTSHELLRKIREILDWNRFQ